LRDTFPHQEAIAEPAAAASAWRPPPDLKGHPAFVWCFVGFLVTNMASGHSSELGLNLPLGPDRILFGASAVLFVFDRRFPLRGLRWGSVHLLAGLTVAVAALSALSHDSLTTSYGFFAILDRLAIPYFIFTFAPLAFRRTEDRLLILRTMALVGIYLGLTAVFELLGPHSLVWPRYILNPSIGIQFGRARGPFAESEADGLTLVAAFWCAVVLARVSWGRWWRHVAAASIALSMTGALLSLTRSVWFGMLFGFLLVAVVNPKVRRWLIGGAAITAVIATVALLGSQTLLDKFDTRLHDDRSVFDRRNTDAAAIRAMKEHPLTGVGWVQFMSVSGQYVRQDPDYPVTATDIEVHNVVLSRTAELGIPGGFLWTATALLGAGAACLRRPRTRSSGAWRMITIGATSAWLVSAMTSPLPYPLPNTLIWLFSGITLAPLLLRDSPERADAVV
jgi:putative inorganic carbon (hco3(-)) transporter